MHVESKIETPAIVQSHKLKLSSAREKKTEFSGLQYTFTGHYIRYTFSAAH